MKPDYRLYTAIMISRIGFDKVAAQLFADNGYPPSESYFKKVATVIGTDLCKQALEDETVNAGLESLEYLLNEANHG